ncbi:hypothetical protein [Nonomuraea sp. NPDC049695]|uniref:hypothetical protein n=1 Tax=Nonomuraea sp. NPDC049695 TaxID=3154734 RepID=UPI00342DCF33
MTGLEIALGAVGRNASEIRTLGEDYDAAIQRLRERANGAAAWGDDGLFGVITAAYAECTQMGLAALTGVSSEITGTGEGLDAVGRNTQAAEDANVRNLGNSTWA